MCSYADASNVIITDKNWRDLLQGEWMVKFYAPWCPACRAMSSTWNEFAAWASKDLDSLSVGSVDVTAQAELNGRFMVTSLPTIYYIRNGEFHQYASSRSLTDFKEFVTEQKWRTIKPMSSWLTPDSFTMTGVSKLFSFSMNLKTFHESLRNDYGLPGWASMMLFGLLIVVVGLALGIVLVLAVDWFMGPQPDYLVPPPQEDKKKTDAVEEDDKVEDEAGKVEEIEETEQGDDDSSVRKRNVKTDES